MPWPRRNTGSRLKYGSDPPAPQSVPRPPARTGHPGVATGTRTAPAGTTPAAPPLPRQPAGTTHPRTSYSTPRPPSLLRKIISLTPEDAAAAPSCHAGAPQEQAHRPLHHAPGKLTAIGPRAQLRLNARWTGSVSSWSPALAAPNGVFCSLPDAAGPLPCQSRISRMHAMRSIPPFPPRRVTPGRGKTPQ